jgi:hypothetical protein
VSSEVVQLSWREVAWGATIGLRRNISSYEQGHKDAHGLDGKRGSKPMTSVWGASIEGALGELAFAKWLGIEWEATVDTYKAPDVAVFQVRTIGGDGHSLLVREDDKDSSPFVLMYGRLNKYQVVGWIKGERAKQSQWLQHHAGRPEAWFVPQHELRPIPLESIQRVRAEWPVYEHP